MLLKNVYIFVVCFLSIKRGIERQKCETIKGIYRSFNNFATNFIAYKLLLKKPFMNIETIVESRLIAQGIYRIHAM